MPAPTKNYVAPPDSDVDPDSPLTTTLMTQLRDNDVNAHEWIGGSYTPAIDHDHDGLNSKLLQANVAAAMFNFLNYT
jgi:hypothetical protein